MCQDPELWTPAREITFTLHKITRVRKNQYKKTGLLVSAALAYLQTALMAATLWFLFTKQVLLKLQSIPEQRRHGYDDPYLSFLGLTSTYLLVGLILYGIILALLPKMASPIPWKIMISSLTSVLPLICIRLTTFGLGLSDPGMLTELMAIALAGGLFPIVQKMIQGFLKKEN